MVSRIWKSAAAPAPDEALLVPARALFVTFEVTDSGAAEKLRRWLEKDRNRAAALLEYIDRLFPRRSVQPQYKADIEGRIEALSYCGSTPEGWTREEKEHSIWFVPTSPEAMAAVRNLPTVSRKELHGFLGWPTVMPDGIPRQQHGYVKQVNRMVRPFERDGKVYVDVPHYDNFKTLCPPIHDALCAWAPPPGLSETGAPHHGYTPPPSRWRRFSSWIIPRKTIK